MTQMQQAAKAIIAAMPEQKQGLQPRWATVTQLSPLRIRFDGESEQLVLTPVDLVGVKLNDRVWTLIYAGQVLIVGRYSGLDLSAYALTANLPVPEKVTRVARSTNLDTGLDVWTTIPWQTEVFDDANAWSSGNATKIITPSGFTRVKLTLYTAWTASTTAVGRFSQIAKNGGNPVALSNRRELFESAETITTGWISTTAGDEFTALANSNGSGADLLGSSTWGGPTWMEAIFRV